MNNIVIILIAIKILKIITISINIEIKIFNKIIVVKTLTNVKNIDENPRMIKSILLLQIVTVEKIMIFLIA